MNIFYKLLFLTIIMISPFTLMAQTDPVLHLGKQRLLDIIEQKIKSDEYYKGLFPIKEFDQTKLFKYKKPDKYKYYIEFKASIVVIVDSVDNPNDVCFWFNPVIKNNNVIDIRIGQTSMGYTGSLPKSECTFIKTQKEKDIINYISSIFIKEYNNWLNKDDNDQMIITENKKAYELEIKNNWIKTYYSIDKKTDKLEEKWHAHLIPTNDSDWEEIQLL